jgi:glycerophosphoryl diester phosphodiesterase
MHESSGAAHQVVTLPVDPFLASAADNDRVRVLGHRGAPAPARPDNSVDAVIEALLQGADGVEIDVRLTTDDVLVCSHDPFVWTRSGARREVAASDSSDLLDGSLATLTELLAAVQFSDGTQVVVEVKPTPAAEAERTASALADVLRSSAGNACITVSSFDPRLLASIRAACADLPVRTALLGDKPEPVAAVVRRAHEAGHDEVHLPLVGIRRAPEVVEMAHDLGLAVAVWTVNGRTDLQSVAELGVDAVITDDVLTAWSELDRVVAEEPADAFALAAA